MINRHILYIKMINILMTYNCTRLIWFRIFPSNPSNVASR
jgi:hypothetical protein